ncbi:hypothetical protein Emag_004593 [Eimeria magna]
MDVDLALVSALQLRELLQQHSPSSPQVQELASQCERLLAVAADTLKGKGADPKVEQPQKVLSLSLMDTGFLELKDDLTEALVFFRSIAAADEDLAKKKQERQELSAVDSARQPRAERTGSDSGKKHRHASSSSSRRRKKDKEEVAHKAEPHVAVQDNLETLFSDWPHADLLDTGPGSGAAASSLPLHQSFCWGEGTAGDAFASANSGTAVEATGAGAVPRGDAGVHRRRGTDSRSKARGKGSRTARQAAQDASSTETTSSSASRSTSTRSRDSRDSTLSSRRHGHWKEKNVERYEEGVPVADGVGSISNGGFQGEVTWEQRVSFFLKVARRKSTRHRDSSSFASKAVLALRQRGQMRFLISCPDDKGPSLSTVSSGSTECGFLFFSIQTDVSRAARGASGTLLLTKLWALVLQRDIDLVARCEAAQKESAALHQQNGALQAHIQQQQQVLMQQQHQLQALHTQVQQMNANLNDAFQRLTAYEAQFQQQLHALHQVQQQRDAAAAQAAADKAKLQREMLQLEDELEAAREEGQRKQELVRKHEKEADRLDRELQQEVGRRRAAESKAKKQDERIAELTILLNNARSRIRHERQRSEELGLKLEAAAHVESSLKAELQASHGLPASLPKEDEEGRDLLKSPQRKQQADALTHSLSDTEQPQTGGVKTSRQPATHALSLVATTPCHSAGCCVDYCIIKRWSCLFPVTVAATAATGRVVQQHSWRRKWGTSRFAVASLRDSGRNCFICRFSHLKHIGRPCHRGYAGAGSI